MRFEEHCAESVRLFGEPWEAVHRWLDEFAGQPGYGMRHRRVRHHLAGIKEVERLFGAAAGPVARRHIISDLQAEGWTEADHFPVDETDYRRMGLY
jgi:hypothetical protein